MIKNYQKFQGGARLHGCTANSITSPVRGYMYIF